MRPCSSYLFIHLSKMYCSPTALQRCHSEPVTVSLAWESALSFVGKRIAAPVCGLARNDKVRRGGRPKTHSAREVAARSAGGGRDVTRFSLPPSAAPTAPSQRGPCSAALPRWRDVVPQGHLFRCAPLQDGVPYARFTAPVCRAGPMCPAAEHRICPGGAHGPRPTRRQHRFSAQKKKALAGFLFLHLE